MVLWSERRRRRPSTASGWPPAQLDPPRHGAREHQHVQRTFLDFEVTDREPNYESVNAAWDPALALYGMEEARKSSGEGVLMVDRRMLLGLLLAVACGSGSDGARRDLAPARVITRGDFLWVAAVDGSAVLAATSPNASINEPFVYETVDVATGRRAPVRLPDVAGCAATQYLHPFDVPGPRVGLLRFCRIPGEGGGTETYALVAYDHANGGVTELSAMPDPVDSVARVADGEFVAGEDSLICSSLSRYRDGARVPLEIALERDGWPLHESEGRFESECHDHGLVAFPAAHPAGGLAFFASPEAKGRRGFKRLDVSFGLYVVTDGVARRIHDVDGWPRGLAWNEAGTALLVNSEDGGIVEVTPTGTARRLAAFHAATMAQVDGGIVAVRPDDDQLDEVVLVTYPPAV
jgi:hypothetical protein